MLAYLKKGKGHAIVLLHGFCESKEIWSDEFVEYLAKDFCVITIDLPGFGQSQVLAQQPATIENFATQIKEVLDEETIHQAVMVGHSLGGYVTLAFEEAYPERLNGFCLFNSTAFPDDDERKNNRLKVVDFVKEHGGEKFVPTLLPSLFSQNMHNFRTEIIEKLIDSFKSTSAQGIIDATLAMRIRPDQTHLLKNAQKPILFIAGKEDRVVPLEKIFVQAALAADGIVHIFENSAHMTMVESPIKSVLTIKRFANYCYDISTILKD